MTDARTGKREREEREKVKKKKTMAAETEASISGSSSEEEEEEGPLGRGLGAENDEDSDEEMLGSGGGRGGKGTRTGAIFVLENASLEVGKVGKTLQLLNCDDHNNFLRKKRKDPADYRPDICHQALLSVLDSPLNKAGYIKAVYVKTKKNVLFEINPQMRVPRTFKRFSGLMSQLLQKLSIRSASSPKKLMRVIKQPVTKYLPVANCRRVGFSRSAEKIRKLSEFADSVDVKKGETCVFAVGVMSHGKIDTPWVDEMISISEYPLSAACCISKITNALENRFGIQ